MIVANGSAADRRACRAAERMLQDWQDLAMASPLACHPRSKVHDRVRCTDW